MLNESDTTEESYHLTLDSAGRIRLPNAVRERLGVEHGDAIVVIEDDDEIRLETAAAALARAQDYFASFVPDGISLADELMAERREEVERE